MNTPSSSQPSLWNRLSWSATRLLRPNWDPWKDIQTDFIISTGRTGTLHLAKLLAEVFGDEVEAVHEPEPDLFHFATGVVCGRIAPDTALTQLREARDDICMKMHSRRCGWYVESNNNLTWIIPLLRTSFPNCRIMHIVRDGRDVVRSWFGKSVNPDDAEDAIFLGPNDRRQRIQATDYPDDTYFSRWPDMDRFARLCWHWEKKDSTIYDALADDDRAIRLKFEDIFDPNSDYAAAFRLVDFLASGRTVSRQRVVDLLQVRKNATESHALPHWTDWSQEQRDAFSLYCGDHMKRSGYELD